MRVLLVEDDTELSQQLHSALDDAGFAVDPVADGICRGWMACRHCTAGAKPAGIRPC